MMTAGRSLGAAGRAVLFQVGLIFCYVLFLHLFVPNVNRGDFEISVQSGWRLGQKLGEYQKTLIVVQYIFGTMSLITLSFIGMELLNAGKCIQKHWKYFGLEL